MTKTNAMRILERLNIPYTTAEYEDNTEHKLELGAANRVAEKTGLDPECVFKTIVMQSESKEIRVFCVPANKEVNLKKARSFCGAKSLESVKPDSLLQLTGYVRGGCSPIGMKRRYPTFIDESALMHKTVYVSAGVRGIQLGLSPENLIQACGAQSADLTLD
ncbi:Cys-tRNA(Pro) deacylase [Treponema sp. OMZ 840]|uniref:Cys-tRNA(Pro) deacylase n=1 Tax=Treponema sp. OMZ 840 TaxID=244313 RepID=UPI003D8F2C91